MESEKKNPVCSEYPIKIELSSKDVLSLSSNVIYAHFPHLIRLITLSVNERFKMGPVTKCQSTLEFKHNFKWFSINMKWKRVKENLFTKVLLRKLYVEFETSFNMLKFSIVRVIFFCFSFIYITRIKKML